MSNLFLGNYVKVTSGSSYAPSAVLLASARQIFLSSGANVTVTLPSANDIWTALGQTAGISTTFAVFNTNSTSYASVGNGANFIGSVANTSGSGVATQGATTFPTIVANIMHRLCIISNSSSAYDVYVSN